jgi:branched-chain amino acid transport system ATP-binding protein
MLQVEGLDAYHGRIQALQGVGFTARPGEITAILGANGAGKSTLMSCLAGLHAPSAGRVLLEGQEVTGLPAEEVVRRGICLVPERRQVFDGLTVRENLMLGAYSRRKGLDFGGEIERVLRVFPALADKLGRLAGTLSGGEQQMLAIGRGLMAGPRVLLIDEMSLGLAPLIIQEILRILARLREESGTTILLVEQNARAALKIADRALVLERGRVVLEGRPEELLRDERVQAAYLGKGYRAGA